MSAAHKLRPSIKLGQLLRDVQLSPLDAERVVTGVALDSRKVTKGDVFFSTAADEKSGVRNISDAVARGAAAIVSNKQLVDECRECLRLIVADVPAVAADAAEVYFGSPSRAMSVVGVTGTNGKTSCVDMLGQAWRFSGKTAATLGTLGVSISAGKFDSTGFTTMDIVENQRCLSEFNLQNIPNVAMEVSSHGIEQGRVAGIHFTVKVITNISRDHLDYHGSMDAYADTKLGFMSEDEGTLVANLDDARICRWAASQDRKNVITYALDNLDAQVTVSDVEYSLAGVAATVSSPWGRAKLRSSLVGAFNLSNVLAVLSTLCSQGESLSGALDAIASLCSVPGRIERVSVEPAALIRNVYIDYAHTPDGLEKTLVALKAHAKENVVCVFGCGGDRDVGKRPIMASIAEAYADAIYVTNDNPRTEDSAEIIKDILAGFSTQENVVVLEDRKQAIQQAITSAGQSDLILLAGKGHEDYQIVGTKKIPFSDFEVAKRVLAG